VQKLVLILSLAVVFLLGCLSATLVPKSSVAPAKAAVPSQWEHRCFKGDVSGNGYEEATTNILTKVGREGWQLVAIGAGARFCFKRPRR